MNDEIKSRFIFRLDEKSRFVIPKACKDVLLNKLTGKGTCRITTYSDRIVIDNFKGDNENDN